MNSKIMEVVESEEKFDSLVNNLGVIVAAGGTILTAFLVTAALMQ